MANIVLPALQNEGSIFLKPPRNGACIFSTHDGCFEPRYAQHGTPIILRSDPDDDCTRMVADLQTKFPKICERIKRPVPYQELYEWFDHHDAHLHGAAFLLSVLSRIASYNCERLHGYVGRWRAANTEAFIMILPEHDVEHLFTSEDREEHGFDFLSDAMAVIKRMQEIEKEQEHIKIQEQHAQMTKNHRDFISSQAPATAPYSSGGTVQAPRAISNPEQRTSISYNGQTRQFPPAVGQFSVPNSYGPLPRLTGSTEVLEHIVPGATRRGDFHSDPTNALWRSQPAIFTAVPSRGAPGPYNYVRGQLIPLVERQGTFGGNIPRGRRNPMKKSSDDARNLFAKETGRHSFPIRGFPQQSPAITSPLWSPNTMQPFHSAVTNNSQDQHLSNRAGPYCYGSEIGQYCLKMEGTAAHPLMPEPDRRLQASDMSKQVQASDSFSSPGKSAEEIPNREPSQTDYNPEIDAQRPILANLSNQGEPQQQLALGVKPVADDKSARGTNIWIGNIPNDFTKATLLRLLQPCQGLRDISELRQRGPSSYAFAFFEDTACAVEAMELIPQTLSETLPTGHFLKTNWSKSQVPFKSEAKGRPAFNPSPGKYRRSSNAGRHQKRASLTETEDRCMTAVGSPASSRKATNVEGQQSPAPIAGSYDRRGQSRSPQTSGGPAAITLARMEHNVGGTPVNTAYVEDTAGTSVPQLTGTTSDIKPHTRRKASYADTDEISPSRPGAMDKDDSAIARSGSDSVSFGQTPDLSRPPMLDGVQESVPPHKNKHSSRKSKPKYANKLSSPESKIGSAPKCLPVTEKTISKAAPRVDSNNDPGCPSKGPMSLDEIIQRNDAHARGSEPSATTCSPGLKLVAPRDGLAVEQSASTALNTRVSPSDKPKACFSVSKSGPGIMAHSNTTDRGNSLNFVTELSEQAASAIPSGYDPKTLSQPMTRDTSNSTVDNALSPSSTAPTSLPRSERSNSIAEDLRLPPPKIYASASEQKKRTMPGIDAEQLRDRLQANAQVIQRSPKADGQAIALKPEASKLVQTTASGASGLELQSRFSVSMVAPGTTEAAKMGVKGVDNAVGEGVKRAITKETLPKKAPTASTATSPKTPPLARTPILQSPERKHAPEIPQRSSSLSVSSTPIHTRLKKKERVFTQVAEEAANRVTGQTDPSEGVSDAPQFENTTQQSSVLTPVRSSPSRQESMSKSGKNKRSKLSKTKDSGPLVPTHTTPTTPTPSPKKTPLPKPETPYRIGNDGRTMARKNWQTPDGSTRLDQNGTLAEADISRYPGDGPRPQAGQTDMKEEPFTPDTESSIFSLHLILVHVLNQIKESIEQDITRIYGVHVQITEREVAISQDHKVVWGECLCLYQVPGYLGSQMGRTNWEYWVTEFVRQHTGQLSSREDNLDAELCALEDSLKYMTGILARWIAQGLRNGAKTPELDQRLADCLHLLGTMPGSPWAQTDPEDWMKQAVNFRDWVKGGMSGLGRYEELFTSRTNIIETVELSPPGMYTIQSLSDKINQVRSEVVSELVKIKKGGSDNPALAAQMKELTSLIQSAPKTSASQTDRKQWEEKALQLLKGTTVCSNCRLPPDLGVVGGSIGKTLAGTLPLERGILEDKTQGLDLIPDNLEELTTELDLIMFTTSQILRQEKEHAFDTSRIRKRLNKIQALISISPQMLGPYEQENWKQEARRLVDEVKRDPRKSARKTIIVKLDKNEDAEKARNEAMAKVRTDLAEAQTTGYGRESLPKSGFGLDEESTSTLSSPRTLGRTTTLEKLEGDHWRMAKEPGVPQNGPEENDAQEHLEENGDEQVSFQKQFAGEGQHVKVDCSASASTQPPNRITKEEGEHENTKRTDTPKGRPQEMGPTQPGAIHSADTELKARAPEEPEDQEQIKSESPERRQRLKAFNIDRANTLRKSPASAYPVDDNTTEVVEQGKQSPQAEQSQIYEDQTNEEPRKQEDHLQEPTDISDDMKDLNTTLEQAGGAKRYEDVSSALNTEAGDIKVDHGPSTTAEQGSSPTIAIRGGHCTSRGRKMSYATVASRGTSEDGGDGKDGGRDKKHGARYEEESGVNGEIRAMEKDQDSREMNGSVNEQQDRRGDERDKDKDPWAIPVGEVVWGLGKVVGK